MKSAGRLTLALLLWLPSHPHSAAGGTPGTPPSSPRPEAPVTRSPAALVATFSVVGFDPATGDLGVAVESKFFGVGTVVPWARAGVGAIATQSYANIRYGGEGLGLLADGKSARTTLEKLTGDDADRRLRQVGIVDAEGRVAAFTGEGCNGWAGHLEGELFSVQGNLLAGEAVVTEMARAYREARRVEGSELADWLMAALSAGQAAGGDKRGRQSAALLVVRDQGGYDRANDRYIDLRVEDHPRPIEELGRLLALHKQFYRRAHEQRPQRSPAAAPRSEGADARRPGEFDAALHEQRLKLGKASGIVPHVAR